MLTLILDPVSAGAFAVSVTRLGCAVSDEVVSEGLAMAEGIGVETGLDGDLVLLLGLEVAPLTAAVAAEDKIIAEVAPEEATVFIVVAAMVLGEAPAALIIPVPTTTWPDEPTNADPVIISQLYMILTVEKPTN